MIGAILGDIIGSHYEFTYHKSKEFELLHMSKNFITDDTLMTIAVGNAVFYYVFFMYNRVKGYLWKTRKR